MRRLLSFHLIKHTFSLDLSLDSSLDDELFPGRFSMGLSSLFLSFLSGALTDPSHSQLHLVPAGLSHSKNEWQFFFFFKQVIWHILNRLMCVQKEC